MLGDKQAVRILFETVGPRFTDRPGGYTRVVRLAVPRLGDNGTRAVLEFVGVRDRVIERSPAPQFEGRDEACQVSRVRRQIGRNSLGPALEHSGRTWSFASSGGGIRVALR